MADCDAGVGQMTVRAMVARIAERDPTAAALAAIGRTTLDYGTLLATIDALGRKLAGRGLTRNRRLAIVLPNGPEMAVAFLAATSWCTAAPLNPGYRAEEFDFYLSDLNAAALLVSAGMPSDARDVARRRGIPIIELRPSTNGPAGLFELAGAADEAAAVPAEPDDVALVLHTSGTTSRPKIVPLSQRNICRSAMNVRDALQLTPADRCLNIMPLFHIHGLIGALLSSMSAGASVGAGAGFVAPSFYGWMDALGPSWYSAVPTMHQAIAARAVENAAIIARRPLRLIRSSSAALPPQVMAELETAFGCPVIEAYGMTEAAHQMASNPLPPRVRKPGSVGVPAGPDVAIMDDVGSFLPPGTTGEVVIRGQNVTGGYENNENANATAFTAGWFRTGDQGYFDSDGYLFLTGRLKELINRGGEKISPREVDEVLLDHPTVAGALTFAMPDARLGEEVAAAVVLKKGQAATARSLREFASRRLADFKVPRRIVFMEEIPKGPTGKPQRVGLAARLGITGDGEASAATPFVAPRTPLEEQIAAIWTQVLKRPGIGANDSFLNLGGDSILAAQIVARIRESMGVEMPLLAFFESPTVAGQAVAIATMRAMESDADLLAGLEAMSDEEAQRLLAEEHIRKETA